MSSCIAAREVTVVFRAKGDGFVKFAHVVIPGRWSKTKFLRYVRAEHPDQTVKIENWPSTQKPDDEWVTRLWIANPSGFLDYARGLMPQDVHGR